jgi:hypothetical protein
MRQTRVLTIAALAMASAAAAACGARDVQTAAGDVALADSTSVVVDNQALTDMTIYVLEGGSMRRRLGTANAVSKTRIAIPRTLVGNGRDLQFLADPFAGRGNSVSQRIFVSPGDQVGLTILP